MIYRQAKLFILGVSCFPKAAKVLTEARLWPWVLAPGIFVALLIPSLLLLSYSYFGSFAVAFHAWLPEWAQYAWLSSIAAGLLWLAAILFCFFLGSQMILALYAPVFGIMSERIEAHLGGVASKPFSLKGFLQDIARAFAVLAIHLIKWLGWALVGLTLLLIPAVGAICSSVFLFFVNAYFSAAGAIDPCLERRSIGIRQTNRYCSEHRLGLAGVGSIFQFILLVPIIGWILAPGLLVAASSLYCLSQPPAKTG